MKKYNVELARKSLFIRLWLHFFFKKTIEPFSLFSLILLISTIYLAYNNAGTYGLVHALLSELDSGIAIFYSLFIWIPFVAAVSYFRTKNELSFQGQWREKRFTFNSPKLIKAIHITPSDNDKKIDITFPDTPKNTTVGYMVEYHGGIAKIQIGGGFMSTWEWINRDKQSGSFWYKGKPKVWINCPSSSDQTTARVYQTFWEVR